MHGATCAQLFHKVRARPLICARLRKRHILCVNDRQFVWHTLSCSFMNYFLLWTFMNFPSTRPHISPVDVPFQLVTGCLGIFWWIPISSAVLVPLKPFHEQKESDCETLRDFAVNCLNCETLRDAVFAGLVVCCLVRACPWKYKHVRAMLVQAASALAHLPSTKNHHSIKGTWSKANPTRTNVSSTKTVSTKAKQLSKQAFKRRRQAQLHFAFLIFIHQVILLRTSKKGSHSHAD